MVSCCVPLHVQQVIGVGQGVQHPLHLSHPGQLLVESLPLVPRKSCARTDTAEGGGLGTGFNEDIASPSSVMVEETPGSGWDRRVEGMDDVMPCAGDLDEGRKY